MPSPSAIAALGGNDRLDASALATLARGTTRLVALRSAGDDNVDVEAAERHGLTVVRVPEYSSHAVAEHTVALVLALDRKMLITAHQAFLTPRRSRASQRSHSRTSARSSPATRSPTASARRHAGRLSPEPARPRYGRAARRLSARTVPVMRPLASER